MIEKSVQRRTLRGIAIWRDRSAEILPAPAGGLAVPSCSEPGRSYHVSLEGEGSCTYTGWRRRRQPCKHIYVGVLWTAKRHAALARVQSRKAA